MTSRVDLIDTTVPMARQENAAPRIKQAQRITVWRFLLFALVAAALVLKVHAVGFGVNTTADTNDTNPGDGACADSAGNCSLRAAIEEANAWAGSDTITLSVPGPYVLTLGQLNVTSALTVTSSSGATISGGGVTRIFYVGESGNLSLKNVTLRDGMADAGGAILNDQGGAVNILNCAILDNVATVNGGGIATGRFSGSPGGTLNIANSTLSGNRANDSGGALSHLRGFNTVTTNLTNVTITNNTADANNVQDGFSQDAGGGIYANGAGLGLKNSLIAGNLIGSTGVVSDVDCSPVFSIDTYGYNLIGISDYFPAGTPNGDNDFVGAPASPLDPLLGGMAGSPAYYAILAGSLAINPIVTASATFISTGINPLFADGATVTTDQRGAPRAGGPAQGGNLWDIGAYEYDSSPTAVELASFTATPSAAGILLRWETATELDNIGFNLYRAGALSEPRVKVNDDLIPSQSPGSVWGAAYQFVDESVVAGAAYYYWLGDVDIYGAINLHGPVAAISKAAVWSVYLPLVARYPKGNDNAHQ